MDENCKNIAVKFYTYFKDLVALGLQDSTKA